MKPILGVAAMAVFSISLGGCEPDADTAPELVRPVKTIIVRDDAAFEQVWFTGRAAATQAVDLSFRVGGSLVNRAVDIGDRVAAGDLIAALDPATFEADVQRLRAQLAQAEAERQRANSDLRRNRLLADRGHVSRAALDKFISAANVAAAAVDAQAAAVRSAELALSYTQLSAPFDGEIVRVFAENFEEIQANQPVARLVDKSRIEMTIDIPESMISLASEVGAIDTLFDPFPDVRLTAEIKEIGSEASEITRTYPVTLIMDQPTDVTILPGMAGRASPRDDPRPDDQRGGVLVPDAAVFAETGGQSVFVWVVDETAMTVSKRRIDVFELTSSGYTVTAGLAPGERIVVAGVNFLSEGQKVRLTEQSD